MHPVSHTEGMKHVFIALMILAVPPVAWAQDVLPAPVQPVPEEKGFDLMEEGAKLLFRGLMSEMEPMLDEMGKAVQDMKPALQDLLALVDDIRNYDAPRILENGDILIPRRKGAPPLLAPAPSEGEIDL